MRDSGTYALVIALGTRLRLRIGALGISDLPSGYYVYVGSALGGLSGRLKRHLGSEKRLRWHIDYLLQQATVVQIWYSLGRDKLECAWNTTLQNLPGGMLSVRGFGASDCRCSTHLTYFPTAPSFGLFKRKLSQNNLPQAHMHNRLPLRYLNVRSPPLLLK